MIRRPRPAGKRPRRIRWLQLSLRTLLLGMVAVSLGMWWYLRPEPESTRLPGGLVMRTGVRTETHLDTGEKVRINHGLAEVIDLRGRVRVRGYFDRDEVSGVWTWFDARGRRVMRGHCLDGRRVGVWIGWHANGRRRFEVSHGMALQISKGQLQPYSDESAAEYEQQNGVPPRVVGLREGPARTWWVSGVTKSEGSFAMDRRHGTWAFWDHGGQLIAQGSYRDGVRQGSWHVWDPRQSATREVYYLNDVRYDGRDDLLKSLLDDLQHDDPEQRIRALLMIQAMEVDGLPALRVALQSGDLAIRRGALDTLVRLGPAARPLVDQVRLLAESDSAPQVEALLACLAIEPAQREPILRKWLALAGQQPEQLRGELLYRLSELSVPVLDELENLLADEQPTTRRQAFEALANLCLPPFFPAAPVSGPDHQRLMSILRRAVEHDDPQIASAATILVDMMGTSLPPGADGIP